MYGKIFSAMYDGSLYGNWEAIVTFQQMIVLCGPDGVVDMTPQALAARTSIPLDIIKKGIQALEAPDPDSRTPDLDGRRIERLDDHRPWGWRIVNYTRYRKLVDAETVREQNRARQQRKRDRDASRGHRDEGVTVTPRHASHAESRQAEAEEEEEATKKEAAAQPAGAAQCSFDACVDAMQAKGTKKADAHATINKLKKSLGAEQALAVASRAIDKADPRAWLWATINKEEKRGELFNPASYEGSLP